MFVYYTRITLQDGGLPVLPQHFLRIALPTPLRRLFDYLPPPDIDVQKCKPGVRVIVPFQARKLIGILIQVVSETTVPRNKLKTALSVLDEETLLTPDVYELCHFASDYYHHALGEVLISALPMDLRKGKPIVLPQPQPPTAAIPDLAELKHANLASLNLNSAQAEAVHKICANLHSFQTYLLDGVTGSGKTEVYLRVIEEVLASGRQILMLVPEISLTPQTIARFSERFRGKVAALHSGLTSKERIRSWFAARSGEADIVIGTRSALFSPFANLGLIIVDEEHDSSFKQQERFRYHARDLAIMRAKHHHIPVILGSATPSLESILNVKRTRFISLALPERAGNAVLPCYQIIDLRTAKMEQGLSRALLDNVRAHLNANNQVMLFLNRRGYAPVLYCTQCRWIVECERCDARLVYHRSPPALKCHYCDAHLPVPTHCARCNEKTMVPVGIGTERLQETLEKYFPDIPILRLDRDNLRKRGAMQAIFARIHEEPKAILLGTQMLAKGHHFPRVTLVGIIDADNGLMSADFRAIEQMGQLIVQVSGRAGRADKPGTVMLQTRNPHHPLLQTLLNEGYGAFAENILQERQMLAFPPYTYFAVIRAEAHIKQRATQFLQKIKKIRTALSEKINLAGPAPALMSKRKGWYSEHLLIKAENRNYMQQFLKDITAEIELWPASKNVKWMIDVDPLEI